MTTCIIERWIILKAKVVPMGINEQFNERNLIAAINVEALALRV